MRWLLASLLLLPAACDRPRRGSPVDLPAQGLFMCLGAQEDFRRHDRDRNGVKDYWRRDVAGLYLQQPGIEQGPNRNFISLALADRRPEGDVSGLGEARPIAGQWLMALRFADEKPEALDPRRFAVCAYPDSPSAGKVVGIMSHDGILYWKRWAAPADTPTVYPDPETLKREWKTWEYQPERPPKLSD